MSYRESRVRVTAIVVMDVPFNWGSDCTIDQVFMQGEREGLEALDKALVGTGVKRERDSVTVEVRLSKGEETP